MAFAQGVYLVRHGETEYNRDGRYQGKSDSPLTELGHAQARRAGRVLADHLGAAPVEIRTSPLGRALQTAEIIAGYLPQTGAPATDDRLSEIGMGVWEGMTRTDVKSGWPEARKGRPGRNWIFEGPGSEPMADALDRLSGVLNDLPDRTGAALILVSHANSGRLLRGLFTGLGGEEAMCLDAPQEAIFQLCDGGELCRIDALPEAYQGFQA